MNKIIPFEITKQWHLTKNGVLKPENFTKGSSKKVWWLCEKTCKEGCKHEWETTIKDRTAGYGCPFCSPNRLKLCIHDSIVGTHPIVANQWHPTKNGDLKKENFGFGSHKKVWWLCETQCKEGCLHEWESVISSRCNGVGCPFCSKPQKQNCIHDSIIHMHPEIEKQWHPTKNGNLKTENITFGNAKEVWWNCDKGECHEWKSTTNNRTKSNGCPFCAGQKICKQEKCLKCKVKTFASSSKVNCWNKTLNKEEPYEVFISAKQSYWFTCDKCNHDFNSSLNNISSGCWCPYCSNSKLCEFVKGQEHEDCSFCRNKSFASSDKADYWIYDKNEGVNPRDIQKYTEKKYWFKCNKCNHNFEKRIDTITRKNGWCPYCVNKTEQKLYDVLLQHYPLLKQQFKVEWCKNKTYLPYDFVLTEDKIIIELDGLQHFEQVSNWSSPEETHKNDVYKMKCATENGYSVIRLLQTDVFYDTYDWLAELKESIEKIKLEHLLQNVYICADNEYDIFTTS